MIRRTGVLLALILLGGSASGAADTPAWIPAVYDDFPVRIELADRAGLTTLLRTVPVASFNREQLAPRPGGGLVWTPRVTAAEAAALARAGVTFERLPDRERVARRAAETTWAARGEKAAPLSFPLTDYPTHAEVGALLADMAAAHPALCDTFVWGTSVQGRELWGIRISDDVQNTEAEPEVRLSSTMHGNETLGLVMLLNLADHLTANHGQPGFADVTALVDGTEIHIMPLHNPDGYAGGYRSNANGVDLNRNFDLPSGTHTGIEVENVRFREYAADKHFVVSLNGHGGALVVNYPWDYTYDRAPDDAALQLLSLEYATRYLPMFNSPIFDQGITHGADWYPATGTLQDWSYDQTGCVDVTLEMSNVKWPLASQLAGFWEENRESLMAYAAAARFGIGGVVTDAATGAPLDATVTVTGNAVPVTTDPAHGDWYKLLPTGTFELTFVAEGYRPQTVAGVGVVWGVADTLNVALQPDTSSVPPAPVLALGARPNPFNPGTTFLIAAPRAGEARLEIFDLRGRRVRTLFAGSVAAGETPVAWDGRTDAGTGVGAGSYLARVRVDGATTTTKVMLVR
jgi:hypothetical protein